MTTNIQTAASPVRANSRFGPNTSTPLRQDLSILPMLEIHTESNRRRTRSRSPLSAADHHNEDLPIDNLADAAVFQPGINDDLACQLDLSSSFDAALESKPKLVSLEAFDDRCPAGASSGPNLGISVVNTAVEQHEDVEFEIKEDLTNDNMAKYIEMFREAERLHRGDVEKIKKQYDEQVRVLQEQLDHRVASLAPETNGMDHSLVISQLKESLASAEARLHDMETEHQKTVSDLHARLNNVQAESENTPADCTVQLPSAGETRADERITETAPEVARLQSPVSHGDEEEKSTSITLAEVPWSIAQEETRKTDLNEIQKKYENELSNLQRQHLTELEQLNLERDSLLEAVENLRQAVADKDAFIEALESQMAIENERSALFQEMEKVNAVIEDGDQEPMHVAKDIEMETESGNASLNVLSEVDEDIFDYYRLHLEARETIEGLQDTVTEQQAEIDTLQSDLAAKDLELSQLKSKIAGQEPDISLFVSTLASHPSIDDEKPVIDNAKPKDPDVSLADEISELRAKLSEKSDILFAVESEFEKLNSLASTTVVTFDLLEEVKLAIDDVMSARQRKSETEDQKRLIREQEQEIQSLKLNLEMLHAEKAAESGPSCEELLEEINRLKNHFEQELDLQKMELTKHNKSELVMVGENWKQKMAKQEAELTKVHIGELEKMKLRLDSELRAREDQIEQLSADQVHKANEISRCKESIEALMRQLEEGQAVSAVQADIDRLNAERDAVNQTNVHLMAVLSDCVRATVDMESRINQFLEAFESQPPLRMPSTPRGVSGDRRDSIQLSGGRRDSNIQGVLEQDAASVNAAFSPRRQQPAEDVSRVSNVSVCSDEGLDDSQRFIEAFFLGPNLESDAEEMITDLSSRMHRSVGRLIDRLSEAGRQIVDSQQAELDSRQAMEASEHLLDEMRARCDDLEQLLKHETETREYLSLEFYKADGLVKGFLAEKQVSEECIRNLENRTEVLIKENERLTTRQQELDDERNGVFQREQDLENQRAALSQSADGVQIGLLNDNSRLRDELRAATKQTERERNAMQSQIHQLEGNLEELRAHLERVAEERRTIEEDHQQKVDALEKQLKSEKQFIEFQAGERELERDEYQQKLSSLEMMIREKDRKEANNQRLLIQDNGTQSTRGEVDTVETGVVFGAAGLREIKDLEDLLQDKSESWDELESAKDRAESELKLQQSTICELQDVIRNLETDLDARCKLVRQHEQKLLEQESEIADLMELNQRLMEDLSVQSDQKDDHAQLLQTIRDLEEQIDASTRSNRMTQEDLHNLRTHEEELVQDRDALQKQVCDQLSQLSEFKSQVDGLALSVSGRSRSGGPDELIELRSKVKDQIETIQLRDKEVFDLSEQLGQLQERLLDQTEELQHVDAQLEAVRKECSAVRISYEDQLQLLINERDHLEAQTNELKHRIDSTPMSVLTQALLVEKNEEIDELSAEVERLNTELEEVRTSLRLSEQQSTTLHSASTPPALRRSSTHLVSGGSIEDCVSYERTIEELRDKLQQADFDLCQTQEALDLAQKENSEWMSLNEMLIEKEATIDDLQMQVNDLLKDIESINESYSNLQDDYSQVEAMAKDKQKEIESMSEELAYLRAQLTDSSKSENEIARLKKELHEKQNVIDEKDEELFELNETVSKQDSLVLKARQTSDQLTIELALKNEEIRTLHHQIMNLENSNDVVQIAELKSQVHDLQAILEDESRKVVEAVASQAWSVGHSEEIDEESSISEQARSLEKAVERNINLDLELFVNLDWNGSISEPLLTILQKLHSESLHILSLSDLKYLNRLSKLAFVDKRDSDVSEAELRQQLAEPMSPEEMHRTQATFIELHDRNAELEAILAEVLAKNAELKTSLAELRGKNAEVEASLAELFGKNAEVEASLAEVLAKNAELKTSLAELFGKNAEVEVSLADVLAKNAELETSLAELRIKNAEVEASLVEERDKYVKLQTSLAELRGRNAKYEASGADLQGRIVELEKKLDLECQSSSAARDDCASLSNKVVQMKTTVSHVEKQLQSAKSMGEEQSRQCSVLTEQLVRTQEELKQAKLTEQRASDSIRKLKQAQSDLVADGHRQRSNVAAAEQQLCETKSNVEAAKTELLSVVVAARDVVSRLCTRASLGAKPLSQASSTDVRSDCNEIKTNLATCEKELTELHSALTLERSQSDEVRGSLAAVQARLSAECVRSQELSGLVDSLRATCDMERARSEELGEEFDELQSQLNVERQQVNALSKLLEEHTRRDEEAANDQGIINDLRAALDIERSNAQELMKRLKQEHEKVRKSAVELNQVTEQSNQRLSKINELENEVDRLQRKTPSPSVDTKLVVEQKQLENVRQRLCLVVVHLQDYLASVTSSVQVDSPRRMMGDMASTEPHSLQRLISELSTLQSELLVDVIASSGDQMLSIIPSLNDTILKHNAELTNYIEQISSEKQELHIALSNLQQKSVAEKQKAKTQVDSSFSKLVAERTKLAQDQDNAVRQLKEAFTEISLLKAENLRLESELKQERSVTQNEASSTDVSRAKVQRLYTKYLRAESFRKSLIYQKRYLLLLIGGFQDGEEETLAMIARMGAFPSDGDLHERRLGPLSRFRTAARVIIAISRLKFVSKRWLRATHGVGSAHSKSGNDVENVRQVPSRSLAFSTNSSERLFEPVTRAAERETRPRSFVPSTPPTKDKRARVEQPHNRDRLPLHTASPYQASSLSASSFSTSNLRRTPPSSDTNISTDDYLKRLENLQAKLGGYTPGGVSSYVRR